MTTADKIIQICDDLGLKIETLYESRLPEIDDESVLVISSPHLSLRGGDMSVVLRKLEILTETAEKGAPNE